MSASAGRRDHARTECGAELHRELVSNWLDHGGRIRKLSCQYRSMDLRGGEKLAEGKTTTPGSAVVVLRG